MTCTISSAGSCFNETAQGAGLVFDLRIPRWRALRCQTDAKCPQVSHSLDGLYFWFWSRPSIGLLACKIYQTIPRTATPSALSFPALKGQVRRAIRIPINMGERTIAYAIAQRQRSGGDEIH
jgi:hypothetical protein